jgi:PAS domain S-box-containing protein
MEGEFERAGGPAAGRRARDVIGERLRLEQERFSFALRAADIVAWEWDPETDEIVWFEEGLQRLGLEREAFQTAAAYFAAIHPEDRRRVETAVESALRGESEYDEELRLLRPDGSILWCVDRGRLVQVEPHGSPRLSGILIDITERKRKEAQVDALDAALARRAEELQVVLDVLPVGVFIAEDASCSVIRSNPAGAAMLGIAPDVNASKSGAEAERLPFRVLREGVEIPPDELAMQRAARTGAPVRGDEVVVERDDGTATSLVIDAIPLFDERERVRGCVGALVDITERKLAELVRDEEARRKDEFLATLAHELRNPLAPIRTALELLRLTGVAEAQRPPLEVIARQVEQLSRLVDDLLDVSRITRGKVELRKAWVEVATVVERALETSGPALGAAGQHVHVELPGEPLYVCGDLTRLSQIVGNLLNNAAKYTGAGGNVWVAAGRRGEEVTITVRDDGPGIAPEVLPRIFELFAQGDTSLERAQGGLGIGLTIAKQLAEMHGGRLTVSPGDRRGSEFTIWIPYDADHARAEAPPSPGAARAAAAPLARRVLVVDDNRDAADTLAALLELSGHEVKTAYGAREALEVSPEFRPEVVFLDIGMPEMNGFEVARRLRQHPQTREALLVAMTGWGQEEDRRRGREAGFDHHLVKPVSPESVDDVIRRARL